MSFHSAVRNLMIAQENADAEAQERAKVDVISEAIKQWEAQWDSVREEVGSDLYLLIGVVSLEQGRFRDGIRVAAVKAADPLAEGL
jgi:hypothetical protein